MLTNSETLLYESCNVIPFVDFLEFWNVRIVSDILLWQNSVAKAVEKKTFRLWQTVMVPKSAVDKQKPFNILFKLSFLIPDHSLHVTCRTAVTLKSAFRWVLNLISASAADVIICASTDILANEFPLGE